MLATHEPGQTPRRLVPPFGWPLALRAVVVTPADRQPRVVANRYPRQIIGVAIRLPDDEHGRRRALSLLWAKPARWWRT